MIIYTGPAQIVAFAESAVEAGVCMEIGRGMANILWSVLYVEAYPESKDKQINLKQFPQLTVLNPQPTFLRDASLLEITFDSTLYKCLIRRRIRADNGVRYSLSDVQSLEQPIEKCVESSWRFRDLVSHVRWRLPGSR